MDENEKNQEKISVLYQNYSMLKNIVINLVPIYHFVGIREGTTYCPFHPDRSHKSAKVYEDEDGISRLYCFGQCQKQYTSFDYIKKIKRQHPVKFLLTQFSLSRIVECVDNYKENITISNAKSDYVKEKFKESEGDLTKFIDLVYFNL